MWKEYDLVWKALLDWKILNEYEELWRRWHREAGILILGLDAGGPRSQGTIRSSIAAWKKRATQGANSDAAWKRLESNR